MIQGPKPMAISPRKQACFSGLLFSCLFLFGNSVIAQTDSPIKARPEDTIGWHTVQPGDTLFNITEKYLGDAGLWPENHRLNPQVKDPHLLRIGSRLRIIISRKMPESTAEVEQVVRKVLRREPKNDWFNAQRGDQLKEKNEVQTFNRASTRLRFEDGAHLDIKENSLVFLRQVGQTLRGDERQSIEIVEGEADIRHTLARKARSDIEIVVGNVRALPQPDDKGNLVTRTRKSDNGHANVMVYDGKTEVAAAGSRVAVPKGMGTVVEEGQAPSPPEKLLPSSRLTSPPIASKIGFANPLFKWNPVPNAASYKFELCNDQDCATPTFRKTGIQQAQYSSETIPLGSHFWRVTAVAASNLDGFPSKARAFTITANRPDLLPPAVVIQPLGQATFDSPTRLILGEGSSLQIHSKDDAAGVAEVQYRWDNGSWKTYTANQRLRPPGDNTARLSVRARDNIGKESTILEVDVSYAAAKPDAPTLKNNQQDP